MVYWYIQRRGLILLLLNLSVTASRSCGFRKGYPNTRWVMTSGTAGDTSTTSLPVRHFPLSASYLPSASILISQLLNFSTNPTQLRSSWKIPWKVSPSWARKILPSWKRSQIGWQKNKFLFFAAFQTVFFTFGFIFEKIFQKNFSTLQSLFEAMFLSFYLHSVSRSAQRKNREAYASLFCFVITEQP